MEIIQRTIYGAQLQTSQLLGLPVNILPHSTLNEKFNINPAVALAPDEIPRLKYITIGNGGHKFVTGADGVGLPSVIQHSPRNAALYNHLPFILRPIASDLTAIERSKYRLRRLETHGGVDYVAYYLKEIDFTTTNNILELRTVVDGITTATEFTPTLSDLSPAVPAISPTGVISPTGDYIASTAKVPFILNTNDITELLNVANIIYGNENYAIISEIGLCSGVDKIVNGNFNGVTTSYTDAIAVQIVSFINSFFAAKFSNDGISVTFDVGSSEPLLLLS